MFIQKSSGFQLAKYTFNSHIMSKRNIFHRTPRFKPEVKVVNSFRKKESATMVPRQGNIEVLPQPIKSQSDKKLYRTIRLENGLTALLISDPSRVPDEEDDSFESANASSTESVSDRSGQTSPSSRSDHESRGPRRRPDVDEEKLIGECMRTITTYRRTVFSYMKKQYDKFSKKQCKMVILNDLGFDTAACALSVRVGSYSDPPDIQGLAHFVEHMVFMGSEKYPKENEFDSFVKKKGGSDNASTDCEVTTFYFEIPEKYLPHAMDMFSQFFVSPLMLKEAMQREREAIESEFAIASPSDTNRKDQLLCSLFPDGHPARTFTWGNLKSLKDDINDDEKLYKAAHEFRRRHYSAHRMTVAVQARMDLDTLQHYVVSTFSQIPTNKLPPDDFSPYNFTLDHIQPEFNQIYYIKPVSDTTEVHLTWCMRSLIDEYESKPHQYISYLLGHEGKGSLLSYLKKKVWALGIYTGNSESGIDYTTIYSLFSTQVVLTKQGLDNIDKVLEAIFSYINMLREIGPYERLFDEIKIIEETSFRYEEESQPSDYVENLVENMHFYPPQHYITGDRLYYKYDPSGIKELLDYMRPDSVNIMILSNKHSQPIEYDLKERWFGTEYHTEEIPRSWMHRWMKVKPFSSFYLPEKNIYITTDFKLIPPDPAYLQVAEKLDISISNSTLKEIYVKSETSNRQSVSLSKGDVYAKVHDFRLDQPNLFRKNRHMELWYKPDFKFRFPTALLYFYFIAPLGLRTPREACLLDIWTDVLQQGLKEEVYPANMADLSHALYVGDKGLTLKISGYNQNIHLLVELITREMRNATSDLTEELFEAVREERARTYHNVLLKPSKLAKDIRMNVLLDPYISPRDKASQIYNLTLEDLYEFDQQLLSRTYMQVLIEGNMAWDDAIRIAERVKDTIDFDPIDPKEFPEFKVHRLPPGGKTLRVMSLNPASTNSIVTNYYQGETSTPQDTAVLEILTMLMEEPVFDALRTKEQLGYNVYSMMRYTFGVLGFSITVNTQVDKFSVVHVDHRVEAFLKHFVRDIKRLNEKTLSATKRSLVQLKNTIDYELKEEVERNWREIVSREYMFNRQYNEADAIETVRLQDVRKWVDDHFPTGNGQHLKKLSVQVMGHKPGSNVSFESLHKNYALTYLDERQPIGDSDNDADFIRDINKFKATLPIFDVPKIELQNC